MRDLHLFLQRGRNLAPFASLNAYQAAYNQFMAKGWESKSVEDQQSDQQDQIRSQEIVDEKERLDRHNAVEARKIQALKMTRARIREQLARTSNERYTVLLNAELQQIDGELQELA